MPFEVNRQEKDEVMNTIRIEKMILFGVLISYIDH